MFSMLLKRVSSRKKSLFKKYIVHVIIITINKTNKPFFLEDFIISKAFLKRAILNLIEILETGLSHSVSKILLKLKYIR